MAIMLIATSMFTALAFLSDDKNIVDYNSDKANQKNTMILGEIPNCPDIQVIKYVKNDNFGDYEDISVDADLGDSVHFWIKVTNTGNVALNLQVNDSLPSGLSYNNDAMVNGMPEEPDDFTSPSSFYWKVEGVDPSETIDITFKADVVDEGEFENIAEAIGFIQQCKVINDTDDASVIVEPCVPGISIEKWVWNGSAWSDHADVMLGDIVTFNVSIYNPSDCYFIHFSGVVFDHLPDNLRYVNGSSTIFPEGHPGHPDGSGHSDPNLKFEDYVLEDNTVIWHRPPSIMPGEYLNFTYNAIAVDCDEGENIVTAHPEGFTLVDDYLEENILKPNRTALEECVNFIDNFYAGYPVEVSNADGLYDVSASVSVNVICEPCVPGISIEKWVWNGSAWSDHADVMLGDIVTFNVSIYNPSDCYLIHFSGVVFDHLPDNLEYIAGSSTIYPEGYINYTYSFIQDSNYFPGPSFSTPEQIELESNTVYWIRPPSIMPGEYLNFTYNAIAVDCDEGENIITAHPQGFTPVDYPGEDVSNQDGSYDVSASASVNVICGEPNISVVKSVKYNRCGEYNTTGIIISSDDWVTFKIEVTNTGDFPLNIKVSDSLPLGFTYANNAEVNEIPHEPDKVLYPLNGHIIYIWNLIDVQPGETVTITFEATVNVCGKIINLVDVVGIYGQYPAVSDEDEAYVFVSCPCIEIVKEANPSVIHSGDLVTYIYAVTNAGNVPLKNVVVTDDKLGVVYYVSGDVDGDGWLDLDETWIFNATANPTQDVCNIGTVTAEDELGKQVSDNDKVCVDVINPGISVVKTVSPCCVLPGGSATWNVTVENTGDVVLTGVYVIDNNVGVLDSMITLLPGEIKYYEYTTNPTIETTNNVQVNGTDPLDLEVIDLDDATVEICEINIDFDVEKEVKKNCFGLYGNYIYLHKNDWVTFKINVTNTGDVALNITICDVLPEGLVYNGYPRVNGAEVHPVNGCWAINNIEPGDTVSITFRAAVVTCGENINTATVTAVYDGYEPLVKEDNATVFVLCPGINIVKTANLSLVCTGEEVTYTYNVTNIGNASLRNVVVTDDKIAIVSGDGDGWLYPGETWFFTAVSVLCENTTNVGTVTAEDEFGKQVSDEDIVFVEVVDCEEPPQLGIEVIKKVKRNGCEEYTNITYVHQCDEVKFLLESTNTGEGTLSACVVEPECDWVSFLLKVRNTGEETLSVFVEDILPAGLTYMGDSYVDGIPVFPVVDGNIIVWDIGDVGFGETVEITFDATVDGQVCGSLINTVYVNGSYQDYPKVTDDDSAEVFVLCPGIDIEKTASQTIIQPGEEVTYTYELNNIGNCRLTNVVVMDDQGLVPIYVSGDTNVDDWLDVDETWIFTASTHLYESTTNIGTVTAEDELGKQVSDNNDAYVEVHECVCTPNISIDKKIFNGEIWVDSLSVESYSTNVTFKITIKNTGTCDLTNIVVIDTMKCGLDSSTDFSITPDEINNGQLTWYLEETLLPSQTISITFNATAHMNTSNEVLVTANSTYDQTPVSANDEVTITKEGEVPEEPILAYAPESLSFGQKLQNQTDAKTIEIWNDGTGTLTYELSKDCSWLELSKTSGTSTGGDGIIDIITVKINTTGLDLGVYTCNISITSNGGDGIVIVNVTVVDEEQPLPPTVNISKPASGKLYFRDKELFKLANTLLIGPIEIVADAESIDATITKMEVYIDDIMKFNDTNSSISFFFNEVIFGSHTIKVKAYDSNGLSTQKELDIRVFNFGRVK